MNKNTISKWFSMFLLMMVAGITGATAQSLTVADFNLDPGQSTEVNITLAAPADQTIYGIQTDITLSDGLTLEEVAAVNAELQFDQNTLTGGATRVALLSLANASLPAGDVIKMRVKAADNFESGTITLANSKLTTTTAGAEISVDGSTANVTKTPAPEPEPVYTSKVTYALKTGDTFTSGQTVEVKDEAGKVVATITYGVEGGEAFKAAKANGSVEGFTNFTEGNGSNGAADAGTLYIITPNYDGKIEVAVVLNSDKAFFVLEDGVALEDYNGIKAEAKYYGTYTFKVKANKVYKVYCTGSKLGFYGFNYSYTAEEEVPPAPVETTATFNFADSNFREKIGTAMADVDGFIYNETFTADGASLQITAGSAPSRVYVDANRGQNLVTYMQYTTLTFKAPEGKAIVQIDFTAAGNSNINKLTPSSGAVEGMVWTGNAEGVRFTQGGTSYLANAIVTMIDKTDETAALPAIEYTECTNIAAFNALAAGTYAKVTLTDAEVIGKSDDGYSTVWMQDATGGCWIQYTSLNDKLAEKTKVNGTVYTIKRETSGNPHMKEAEATTQSTLEATAIESYTTVEGTIEEVNVAANLNKVVKIAADSLVMTSASAGTLYVGETFIDMNNGAANANQQLHKIADWKKDSILVNVTVEAILVAKSATANQLLPISIVETTTPEPPVVPTITNASFEADGEKAVSNGPLELTGWTFAGVGTQFNNTELRGANSESTTSQFGTSAPNDGDYSLFFRQGWNGNGNVITITSDALTEIPSGDYMLSVAYKQHYSYDNTTSDNTFVGLSLVNGETTIATGNSPAATGVNGGSADATYFNDTEWSTLELPFTLSEAITGAQIVITLNAGGQRRSDFFLDNVKLVEVAGIEVALKELEKAIAAAQDKAGSYTIGEGLFTYAASEIEPLTTAIATAQAAYTAAESKAAVEAATATLNAFVERFAPVATTPAADKTYTFQLRLGGETPLYMALAESGITIAEEATPLKFIAVEGADGQYNLANEDNSLFVGLQGGDAWTMSAQADNKAAWTFTALPDGAYRINNLVTAGRFVGTNAADKEAGKPCYADKKTDNGNVDWLIAEYVAPTELAQTLDVERYAGLGYTAQEATVDFTEAKTFLGVEEVTTDMLRIVNPDGTQISDYATYDGWFNGQGAAETWGENTKVCVKFFQAITEGKFEICDMNGADSIGATYTVKWALVANDKQVTYTINVKFVEKPVVDLKFADLSVMDTKTVALTSELGKCYEGLTADVDVAAILAKLEVTSLDDLTIYAVQSDGSLDDNYKLGTTDGWRDSTGNWQTWGDNAYFFVKADFSKESAQIYEAGGMEGKNTTAQWQSPATYTATYAFVKTGTADAVVLKVTLTYTVPTGIINIARDAQKSVIYNINGQKVNKAQKGMYIINGKKVVVK